MLPPDFNGAALGTGAVFTLDGLVGPVCPSGARNHACLSALLVAESGAFLVRTTPGPQGTAALATLSRDYPSQVNFPHPPTDLVNFGEAVNFPLIFGLIVVLFGVATLLHMLLSSLNRRRQEMGLLKSLGFVRRQIALSVSWQTTTVAAIGIVLGVPLGIAAGRLVWNAFASNLGVVAVPVVDGMGRRGHRRGDAAGGEPPGGRAGMWWRRAPGRRPCSRPSEGQASRYVRSSKVSRRTATRAVPPETKTTAGRGTLL